MIIPFKKLYYIFLILSSFLLMGCGHINVYIPNLSEYSGVPSFEEPIKFHIKNSDFLSKNCTHYYPKIFTSNEKNAIPVEVSAPFVNTHTTVVWRGEEARSGVSQFLGAITQGFWPTWEDITSSCSFQIKIENLSYSIELRFNSTRIANIGLIGLFLPTSFLVPVDPPLAKGYMLPFITDERAISVQLNEDFLKDYCQIFVHLISTIPDEKITEWYYLYAPKSELL